MIDHNRLTIATLNTTPLYKKNLNKRGHWFVQIGELKKKKKKIVKAVKLQFDTPFHQKFHDKNQILLQMKNILGNQLSSNAFLEELHSYSHVSFDIRSVIFD